MEAMEAKPSIILPGKIMELVSAIGMRIMVVTIWQKGISQARRFSCENVMEPRALIRFTIKVSAKNNASVMNPHALYRSVFPVYKIRKKSVVRKVKVTRKATDFSGVERSGGPPAINSRIRRIMGKVSSMDFPMLPSVA
jgi:hypothetical protein